MSLFNLSIIKKLISGEERSIKVKKNIAALALIKGISVIITLLIVPLTLHYLNPVQYGIWLTLSSIAAWMIYFDFGLGNGLRNKLAEALAHNDFELARSYVSTAYILITLIIIGFMIIFFVCNQFLNWTIILNTSSTMDKELSLLAVVVFLLYGIRLVSVLIETVLIADQKPALANYIELIGSMLSLLLTYILVKTTQGSLVLLGTAIGLSTAIVPASASLFLFNSRYSRIAPAWKYYKRKYSRQLMSLGFKFFILQITALIIFSTSNIIITQLFSPAEVVPYNIAFKYYSIATMVFAIILMPFWSAYTEAYARDDIAWIQKSIRKLKGIWVFLVIGVILMTIVANIFYDLWLGKAVRVPFLVSIFMGIYVLETTWCNIFVNFINGIGKIRLQLWTAIVIGITTIPLSVIFGSSCHLGIAGVILAPCVLLSPLCILWPVQASKILSGTAKGIWNK
jgi:O-antigen/teichoic acid export membrane protein